MGPGSRCARPGRRSFIRTKNQPAAVGNGHGLRSIVSGLLFTMISATPTCRAVSRGQACARRCEDIAVRVRICSRSEEHTSELQSLRHLVCRLLLEKKKKSKK